MRGLQESRVNRQARIRVQQPWLETENCAVSCDFLFCIRRQANVATRPKLIHQNGEATGKTKLCVCERKVRKCVRGPN